MQDRFDQLSHQARLSVQRRDWKSVYEIAELIKKLYKDKAEGFFLSGLAEKAFRKTESAKKQFYIALNLDEKRYDAAIEIAGLEISSLNYNLGYELLIKYQESISNSPLYLNFAGSLFSNLGLHSHAWPLFNSANKLQPGIAIFESNLASASVLVGKASLAKSIYQRLIKKNPSLQKNHYELSKISRATSSEHITQMKAILNTSQLPPSKNIFLYYAIGKELEDLEQWQESFEYYEKAGKAVTSVSNYKVDDDIDLIDQIIKTCNAEWLSKQSQEDASAPQPIFIVGLPRTGTTLIERIIASHSAVESVDETFFMQMAIRKVSGHSGLADITKEVLTQAANKDIDFIAKHYREWVDYKLTGKPVFIDKYPFNFLNLGFIAKAFPAAKIIYLKRNPMDACFAMFKQSFFKFAYNFDDLGRYYLAQAKLRKHWKKNLGQRLIEVDYESFVSNQEVETRKLLDVLGLNFEKSCLEFEKNPTASATASTLQIREKVHGRSVNKWLKYEKQLEPLKEFLIRNGIELT